MTTPDATRALIERLREYGDGPRVFYASERELLREAASALERLSRELAELQKSNDHWHLRVLQLKTDNEALLAEREREAADARRYEWLRTHGWLERGPTTAFYFGPGCSQSGPKYLDDAIDEAMNYSAARGEPLAERAK